MESEKSVDQYILNKPLWGQELELLRETLIELGLEEHLKWGAPAYVDNKMNIVGLAAFKNYVGIWFFQGALLKDPEQKLYKSEESKAVAMRQWRFTSFDEIADNLEIVEQYVLEAIQNTRNGIVVKPQTKKPLIIPSELMQELDKSKELKAKFEALNLTKKREFCEHITSAKRAKTKQVRLAKVLTMIDAGIGLNDKYRK